MRSRTAPRIAGLCATLAIGLLASAYPATAHATVVVAQSRAQLVERADLIVRATVVSQQSAWNEDHTQILTLTRLRVAEYVKGQAAGELLLRQFGGQIGSLASRVAGDGHLAAGQDVVLCLRQGAGVVYLSALAQSVWFIDAATGHVRRDFSETTFAVSQGGRYALTDPPTETSESVTQLIASLRALGGGAR